MSHEINFEDTFAAFELGFAIYNIANGEYISGTPYYHKVTKEFQNGNEPLSYHDLSKQLVSEGNDVSLQTKLGKFHLEESRSIVGDQQARVIHFKPVPDLRQLFEDAATQMSEVFVHRLRSPLTGVKGFAEIVKTHNTNPEIESEIEFIEKGLSEVTGLLDLAMQLSDPVESSVSEVSSQNLCNSILNQFSVFDRRKIQVQLKSISVTCDAQLTIAIVTALLKNALDASKDVPDQIELLISNDRIQVKNFGNVIPRKHLKTLFTPFFTTKARGMGLGLFLSQKQARSFDAKIALTSNSKKSGVVFTLHLNSQ